MDCNEICSVGTQLTFNPPSQSWVWPDLFQLILHFERACNMARDLKFQVPFTFFFIWSLARPSVVLM